MRVLIFFIHLLIILPIAAQSKEVKTVQISPFKEIQNYEHFKRPILNSNDQRITHIAGFNFEWGFIYELEIEASEVSPRLSDGTSVQHRLIKVISKTPVEQLFTFEMFLDNALHYRPFQDTSINHSTLKRLDTNTFRYFDEINILIPEELLHDFEEIVNGETKKIGKFSFIDATMIKLEALR